MHHSYQQQTVGLDVLHSRHMCTYNSFRKNMVPHSLGSVPLRLLVWRTLQTSREETLDRAIQARGYTLPGEVRKAVATFSSVKLFCTC
jgi:hypothetical protein